MGKAELPWCVPTETSGRKGYMHKCSSHCAMGRGVSTLVVLEGCSGICAMNIFALEGQAQLLSSFWTEKLRTSHVQSEKKPSCLTPIRLYCLFLLMHGHEFLSCLLTQPVSYKKEVPGTLFRSQYTRSLASEDSFLWEMLFWHRLAAGRFCCWHAWIWKMIAAVRGFKERFMSRGQLALCQEHGRGVWNPMQGSEDVAWASECVWQATRWHFPYFPIVCTALAPWMFKVPVAPLVCVYSNCVGREESWEQLPESGWGVNLILLAGRLT